MPSPTIPDTLANVPNVADLVHMQTTCVELWHRQPIDNPFSGLEALVCEQHAFNFQLWHQEDIARSAEVSDTQIATVKRAIDSLNQSRNDTIEKIDDVITQLLSGVVLASDAPLCTETPGSAIDRLSIMALRIFHYREERERDNVDDTHRNRVAGRIKLCESQLADLARSLQELLNDQFAGRKQHKTYRQFKMYNDPSLNPEIYRGKRDS